MSEQEAVDVAALRSLAEAATPGPWEFRPRRGFQSMGHDPATIGFVDSAGYFVMLREGTWATEGDMGFIAAANPTAILALIERVEAAEAAVERVRTLRDDLAMERPSSSAWRGAYRNNASRLTDALGEA